MERNWFLSLLLILQLLIRRLMLGRVVAQLLSHVQLFVTPWTAAHQAPLSSAISQSLLKVISIEPVMSPNHLVLCCTLLRLSLIFPSVRVFSNELASGGQSIRASVSASVLLMNVLDRFPLELTGLISLQSKGLSRVFSSTIIQRNQFFVTQSSLRSGSHIHT